MESVEYTADLPADNPRTQTAVDLPEEPIADSALPVEDVPEAPEAPAPEEPAEPTVKTPVSGEAGERRGGAAIFGNQLVYHKTFGDWRVHEGTDYLAPSGTRVYAVSDGEVTEVTSDPLWGACVTLKLTDGRHGNLSRTGRGPKVKQGGKVKAGDVIGSAAAVVPAEAEEGAHVHLELRDKDGVTVDPSRARHDRRTRGVCPRADAFSADRNFLCVCVVL